MSSRSSAKGFGFPSLDSWQNTSKDMTMTSVPLAEWHQGGIIDSYKGHGFGYPYVPPDKFVEIQCLFCKAYFSVIYDYFKRECAMVICTQCHNRFMACLDVCDPECERRVYCLGVGILVNVRKCPTIDLPSLRQQERNWILRPDQLIVKATYNPVSGLIILTQGVGSSESNSTIQDDWIQRDPFQLPNVSER